MLIRLSCVSVFYHNWMPFLKFSRRKKVWNTWELSLAWLASVIFNLTRSRVIQSPSHINPSLYDFPDSGCAFRHTHACAHTHTRTLVKFRRVQLWSQPAAVAAVVAVDQ